MVNGPEFSFWRMLVRAWWSAWAFFESWRRDVGVAVFSLFVGEAIYFHSHGLPDTWRDGVDNLIHAAAPAVALWLVIFAWHFLMAPFSVLYEAAKASAQQPVGAESIGVGDGRSFSDDEAKRMGGKLVQLGEVIQKPGFKGFEQYSTDEMYFKDIIKSAHVIWSRQDALQLRRDFESETIRIIAANKARDEKERIDASNDLSETVRALAAILIAQAR